MRTDASVYTFEELATRSQSDSSLGDNKASVAPLIMFSESKLTHQVSIRLVES